MYSRPQMTSPSVTIFACGSLLLQHRLYTLANSSQRLLQNGNLVFSRHVAAGEFEVFLKDRG